MNKTIIRAAALLAVIGAAFAGCNSSTDPSENPVNAVDVVYSWGEPGYKNPEVLSASEGYPGYTLDLADCPNIDGIIGDISTYSSVIVDAVLYDRSGEAIQAQAESLAQFSILKDGSSGWDDENKLAEAFNMKVSGTTTANVAGSSAGKPGQILLQASGSAPTAVGYIEVKSLTFKIKVSDVTLGVLFGSDYVQVEEGNRLTFINATNSDGAAYYDFPAAVLPLTGKNVVVAYTLQDGYDETLDHQIIIQAADGDDDVNYSSGAQQYKDMNDPTNDPKDPPSGTFTIDGDALEEAAASGGFTLTRIRIVNNGGEWMETGVRNHVREKSYSVTFDSITVSAK